MKHFKSLRHFKCYECVWGTLTNIIMDDVVALFFRSISSKNVKHDISIHIINKQTEEH